MKVGALFLAMLLLAACSSLGVIENIVTDTAAALPLIEAAGVPVPAQVVAYVGDVAACIGTTSAATPAQLASIAQCLSSEIAPQLSPGTPQTVVNMIAAIAKDVLTFLSQHPASSAKLTQKQAAKLEQLRIKARATMAASKAFAASGKRE